jgi:hypothetical protein
LPNTALTASTPSRISPIQKNTIINIARSSPVYPNPC